MEPDNHDAQCHNYVHRNNLLLPLETYTILREMFFILQFLRRNVTNQTTAYPSIPTFPLTNQGEKVSERISEKMDRARKLKIMLTKSKLSNIVDICLCICLYVCMRAQTHTHTHIIRAVTIILNVTQHLSCHNIFHSRGSSH